MVIPELSMANGLGHDLEYNALRISRPPSSTHPGRTLELRQTKDLISSKACQPDDLHH